MINKTFIMAGNLSTALLHFFIIICIARLGDLIELGTYTYVFAVLSPIFIFANMKLRAIVSTDLNNNFSVNEYFSYRLIIVGITFIIALIVFSFFSKKYFIYSVLIGIFKSLEIISDFIYGVWQKNSEFFKISISMLLKNILSIVMFFGIYLYTSNLILALLSINLVYISFLVLEARKFRFIYKNIIMKKIWSISYFLGFSGLIASLVINLPRYFLEYVHGETEVGIYSTLSYFLVLFNIYVMSLGQLILPKLNKAYFSNELIKFNTIIFKSSIIALVYGIFLYIAIRLYGKDLITILFGVEVAAYYNILEVMFLGALFLYATVYLGTALNAMRKFNVQLWINLLSLIVVVITSILIIPNGNLNNTAYVITITNIFTAFLYILVYLIFIKKWREKINKES